MDDEQDQKADEPDRHNDGQREAGPIGIEAVQGAHK